MERRDLLKFMAATGVIGILARIGLNSARAAEKGFSVTLTDSEWKAKLSPEAYDVLRHQATERPFTSPLNEEHRKGVFSCVGCATEIFPSGNKFDSGTGWPSFFAPIDEKAVETTTDYKMLYPRVEVHCVTCGGHLGHVFEDGPKPTGLRYCMNGVAMTFAPDKA